MTASQERMLATVADIGMCSTDVIAETLGMGPGVTARVLDSLFRRGLVTVLSGGNWVATTKGHRRLGAEIVR